MTEDPDRPTSPRSPSRILLIDDEQDFTDLLKRMLESHGFVVFPLNDPTLALAKAKELHPDLVIVDFFLQPLLGSDVALLLKSDRETKHIPIIFLAATADQDDHLIAAMTGAAAYLAKPCDEHALLEAIRTTLGGGRG